MLVKWNDNLSTGILEIDSQHKELFNRINKLYTACKDGKAKEEIWNTVLFLEEYVVEHFDTEEKYMEENYYPFFSKHVDAHLEFIKLFTSLKNRFDNEEINDSFMLQLNYFLINWISQHYRNEDILLAKFLLSRKDKKTLYKTAELQAS